jgi:hypothetical protein
MDKITNMSKFLGNTSMCVFLHSILFLSCKSNDESRNNDIKIADHLEEQTEIKAIPLSEFYPLIGKSTDDPEFKDLIQKLKFSENPKRRGSWSANCGVYLQKGSKGNIYLTIRGVANRVDNIGNNYNYQGDLPFGLIAGETKEDVIKKLGNPEDIIDTSQYIQILDYTNFSIAIHSGTLNEITMFESQGDVIELALDPPMPPQDLKEEWTTLEKKGFKDWKDLKFLDVGTVADGASVCYTFRIQDDSEFDVLIANPGYWTEVDKVNKRQVIYLIVDNRFYLLKPESEQEKQLLKMIKAAEVDKKNEAKNAKELLKKLCNTIETRESEWLYPLPEEDTQTNPSK